MLGGRRVGCFEAGLFDLNTVEARRKAQQGVFALSVGRGLIAAVRAGADRDR